MPGSPSRPCTWNTRWSTTFAMPELEEPRHGERQDSRGSGSGDPRQPQPGLLELRLRRQRLGGVPHPRERRLAGLLDHDLAEPLSLFVLLRGHLDAEQPLEDGLAGLA